MKHESSSMREMTASRRPLSPTTRTIATPSCQHTLLVQQLPPPPHCDANDEKKSKRALVTFPKSSSSMLLVCYTFFLLTTMSTTRCVSASHGIPPNQRTRHASAQILTRDIVPSLSGSLDAGDLVEVYALTRRAKIKMPTPPAPLPETKPEDVPVPNAEEDAGNEGEGEEGGEEGEENPEQEEENGGGDRSRFLANWRSGDEPTDGTSTASTTSNTETVSQLPPPASTLPQPLVPVMVRKTALAFRYRPSASSMGGKNGDPHLRHKPSFELTLEYGPQRTGPSLDSEAMPIVDGGNAPPPPPPEGNGTMPGQNGGDGLYDEFGGLDAEEEEGKFVSWQNEGLIYYETSIDPEVWDSADYLAPITGAVLAKILDRVVVEYAVHHPRYQPFEVYDVASDSVLVHSSSSDDFVWHVYHRLAALYVNLRPILSPNRKKLRLYVNTSSPLPEEDSLELGMDTDLDHSGFVGDDDDYVGGWNGGILAGGGGDALYNGDDDFGSDEEDPWSGGHYKKVERVEAILASQEAGDFIEDLYRCVYALRNGEPLEDEVEEVDNEVLTGNITDAVSGGGDEATALNVTVANETVVEEEAPLAESKNTTSKNTTSTKEKHTKHDKHANETSTTTTTTTLPPEDAEEEEGSNAAAEEEEDTEVAEEEEGESEEEGTDEEEEEEDSDEAEDPESDGGTRRILSTTPNDVVLQENDGTLIPSSIAQCFESKKFQVGRKAFLYIDGASYYKVHLAPPYVEALSMAQELPIPQKMPEGQSDFVDWSLALLIVGGIVFGVYMVLVQIGMVRSRGAGLLGFCNNGSRHDLGGNGMHSMVQNGGAEGGQVNRGSWVEDAIPLSMGGRSPTSLDRRGVLGEDGYSGDGKNLKMAEALPPPPLASSSRNSSRHGGQSSGRSSPSIHPAGVETPDGGSSLAGETASCDGDVMMVQIQPGSWHNSKNGTANNTNGTSSCSSSVDGGSTGDREEILMNMHLQKRRQRDPGMVAMPDLTSRSKVALPVSVSDRPNQNGGSTSRDGNGVQNRTIPPTIV